MKQDALILVRGGGDLATGTIHRLWSAGLRVLVLETAHPAAIRRQVSLCEAVYEGASFPSRTATRSRSTGTRKNSRSRHKPAPFCSRKEFLDKKSVAGNRADPVCRYADAVCPALSLAPHH